MERRLERTNEADPDVPMDSPYRASSALKAVKPKAVKEAVATLLAAASTAFVLAGCAGAGGGNSLTLYSGQHQQTTAALASAFQRQTGVHVQVRKDDEDSFVNEIESERSHPRADLFYTENSPPLQALQNQGLLAPVSGSTLAQTPNQYNSAQGDWVGVSARVSTIVYNPKLISADQLPTSVTQMAEPRYRGKLGIAPSETDFQPIVTAVDQASGPTATTSWLKGLKTNAGSHNYPNNEDLVNDVNRGTVAFGVVDQYYWYRVQAELGKAKMHSQLAYFAPRDPGYVVDVSGAAVLKSSKHQAEAQKFLAFLVSRSGQETISKGDSYEYPLDGNVPPGAPETPFAQLQPNPITIAQLGDGSAAVGLLKRAGLL